MPPVSLPLELVLAIADWLIYTDYEGFLTYLEFRKTSRQLHSLLRVPVYPELIAHKEVFLKENILPCSACQKFRPASTHFFGGLRADGIGWYRPAIDSGQSNNCVAGSYHIQGEGSTCIDCGVKAGRYLVGERFSIHGHGHFCICTCCGGLGRSSVHMQVCSPCFDEDWGTSGPNGCHRNDQRDRLNDVLLQVRDHLMPVRGAISGPEMFLPEI